ncbi:hypothetical protein QTI33_15745 [Variovorax sp. J22P271]|uniref:hypothetical protein n=1 Tax=Variovorax davisae TaxID=3053515 RepID=UPI002577D1AB|nr:hypothetical protein [Variovorax sp. J22P271]MDM0033586.1 hypothetical protein [Variovorax sp. J22P271]
MISHFFSRWRCGLQSLAGRLFSPRPTAATAVSDPAEPSQVGGSTAGMRSLEELRADLARLRASSKERHAAVPMRRQQAFDDEVFADFVAPATPAPDRSGEEDYARTMYVPRAASKPHPAK